MNKAQLIEQVAERLETSRKDASEAVEAVFAAITDSVSKGERVAISGFGIFEQVFRQARIGRNPRTGETVKIGAVTLPKFRPGRDFKNLVSGAREATRKAAGRGEAEAEASQESAAPSTAAKATTTARKTTSAAAKKTTAAAKKTTSTAAKKTTAAAKKTTTTAAKKTTAAASSTTAAAKKTTATAAKKTTTAAKKTTAAAKKTATKKPAAE